MRRNFGLNTTSMAERSGAIRLPEPAPAVASPTLSPEPELASADLSLPLAPASWRGCHGRRSVSVE